MKAEDGSLALFFGNAPRVYVNRGADFSSLKRDCSQPALASADRRTPESYENWEWISAVYREDSRWHAFISNEFHDTFLKPMAPAHVFAPPPNVWIPPSLGELPNMGWQFVEGYRGLGSLVRRDDGFVYGVTSVQPSHSEPASHHPCLIRTDNLGDPANWRAWDGTGFSFRMVSPYVLGAPAPICQFVAIPGGLITFNTYLSRYMNLDTFSPTIDEKRFRSFVFHLSAELLHWSSGQLITEAGDAGFCPSDPERPDFNAMYPTLIDHADTTTNFERPGRTPYLYYVRFNTGTMSDPLYWADRDLVRVPLTFTRID